MTMQLDDREARTLITPEGVDLRVRLASRSERMLALLIDFVIMGVALIALTLISVSALTGYVASQVVQIIWLLGFFLLRNFYFTFFESTPRAATPGKRIMRLRVAMRHGGPVQADAIVARNALRELELYLPLSFMVSQGGGLNGWLALSGWLWCLLFALLPWFNGNRLRAGDIIAGTWVLKIPKPILLADLAGETISAYARFAFTAQQLEAYGIKELHVLESVLRASDPTAMQAVAERIRIKIGWRGSASEGDFEFLNAYYRALRHKLERRMLFGVRKKDKFDAKG